MKPTHVNAYEGSGAGPLAGFETEDLNVTLLAWPQEHAVEPHVNNEVDVVTVILSGTGEATLNGETHPLTVGSILVIPKGAERSFKSLSPDFRYLNVHKRRKKLMPTLGGRPPR